MFELSFIWAGLIAFAVLAYVLLDDFDLGIALLFPFWRDRAARHLVMNTIAPVWDGNETWLALPACVVLVLMTLNITALTIGNHPENAARWIAWPTIFYSGLVPILMTFAGVSFGFGLRGHHDLVPFLATIAIFILSFIGLGTRFYPNLAPRPDHCAGRRPRHIPAVSTGGRGPIDPDDPDRHALFLLGLSRQGSPRRRLSLMRKALWFLGLCAASILALGTVALAIRAALFW